MNFKKLAPWNWFKNEEEETVDSLPARVFENRYPHGGSGFPESMTQFQSEMDRMFENALEEFGFGNRLSRLTGSAFLRPRTDIAANEKEYAITIEVPGIEEKDINVEIRDNTMTIRGEKKQSNQEQSKHFYRMERSYGAFQRVLTLPDDADQDQIQATFKNGLLTVTLPRKDSPESWGKQIEIKTA